MSIQNKKSAVVMPLVLALVLVLGIFIGLKLSNSDISDRLLIYPHIGKVNSVLNLIEDSYVDSVSKDKLEEIAIESVLDNLDPHSLYIPADKVQAVNEPLEGNFSGIGVQFNIFNDTVIIINVVPKGPSEKVGIKAGDRLIKVNDTIVAGVKMDSEAIMKLLKGKKGSLVNVSVKRTGNKKLLGFTITRDIIPISSIDASYIISPGIGYIRINKFAKTTHEEFLNAARDLHKKGMKKIIIDLRDNGGGFLDQAIKISDEFLDAKKLIVYTEGRNRPRVNSYSTPGGECLNDSLVILINELTASASEIFAGAIQDNDRGLIIGRRSFGKGLVQEQSALPGGAAIRLTIARYYTPTGRCIQKPYDHGTRDYYEEIHERFLNGEFEQSDSIKFNDSLKYTTPKGRIVYGGGGIMPDIFVPLDTSFYNSMYFKIRDKGLLYKFAFEYSDANRRDFNKCKTYNQLQHKISNSNLFDRFVSYSLKTGIEDNASEIEKSRKYINNQLEALIVRNFFDNDGYFPVLNEEDSTVLKAVKVLRKENLKKIADGI